MRALIVKIAQRLYTVVICMMIVHINPLPVKASCLLGPLVCMSLLLVEIAQRLYIGSHNMGPLSIRAICLHEPLHVGPLLCSNCTASVEDPCL